MTHPTPATSQAPHSHPSAGSQAPGGVEIAERTAWSVNGALALLVSLVLVVVGAWLAASSGTGLGVALLILGVLLLTGITVISPGDTRVVQLFGAYIGTIRRTGLLMTVPFTTRRKVSVKVNNFATNDLKVNDADGNPVNIAAIVVWQVADTAKSVFAVREAEEFVAVQSESALRRIAGDHPYDNAEHGEETLRGATDSVADELAHEVGARIALAGLRVVEARISTLAYAPEIAQAMLQRQQAGAIIAARSRIVEGAVSMVEQALARLEDENVVALDEERKANMVSNLLVVLCGESRPTPVVNAGSLYA